MKKVAVGMLLLSLALGFFLLWQHFFRPSAPPVPSAPLRFLGDIVFPPDTLIHQSRLGGISGISFLENKQVLLAVTDDRGKIAPHRFYMFYLRLTNGKFGLIPHQVILLRDENDLYFPGQELDFEAIGLGPKQTLFLSTEGHFKESKKGKRKKKHLTSPQILQFDLTGKLQKQIEVPDSFKITQKKEQGAQDNSGLESLSFTPSKKRFFVGMERALVQDLPANPQYPEIAKILLYEQDQDDWVVRGSWDYPLDKKEWSHFSLVDILATGEDEILTLERLKDPGTNEIKALLYEVKISPHSKELQKTLVARLEDYQRAFSQLKLLGNVEAMTFGPPTPQGHPTLIFATDNDFKKDVGTQFLAFEWIKSAKGASQ